VELAQQDCPVEYREYVFSLPDGGSREALTWHRVKEFQLCALKLIAGSMLSYTPRYCQTEGETGTPRTELAAPTSARTPRAPPRQRKIELFLNGELSFPKLSFPGGVPTLYVSPSNRGAGATVRELAQSFKGPQRPRVTTKLPSAVSDILEPQPSDGASGGAGSTHKRVSSHNIFVLYLNAETWAGDAGERLASEVRAAREVGMHMVMLHENDPERGGRAFARFFQTTPEDLVNDGLYDALALAMHAHDYRQVSLLQAAQALGAQAGISWHNFSLKKVWRWARGGFRSGRGKQAGGERQSANVPNESIGGGAGDAGAGKKPRGRSMLRSLVFGAAAFRTTSAVFQWASAATPAQSQTTAHSPLLLAAPPPAASVHERVLFPREQRALSEFLTIQQPDSYFRDSVISFVNLDVSRETAVSCECTKEVQLRLFKTEQGVVQRSINMLVAQDPNQPLYANWAVVNLQHIVPRPLDFVSFESRMGAVAGPGVQMRLAANSMSEAGMEAGYEANVLVNVSQAGAPDSDVPFDVAVGVFALSIPNQTVWGTVAASAWCNETVRSLNSTLFQPPMPGDAPMTVMFGSMVEIPFTACDIEGLPLQHSVPTTREQLPDPRSFTAFLRELPTNRNSPRILNGSLSVPVRSPSGGRYIAQVTPMLLGTYGLELHLGSNDSDQRSATPSGGALRVTVVCPTGLVADSATQTCTCDRGFEPADAGGDPLAAGCKACSAGVFKPDLGGVACKPCPEGTVQPKTASVSCNACLPSTFSPTPGRLTCELCPPGTNSTAPYSSCEICEAGRYRTSASIPASTESCRSCIFGADCPYQSTTLPTIDLDQGTWRLSDGARFLQLCTLSDNGTTACRGGPEIGVEGDGYCEPGHTGPLCEVCLEENHYFSWREATCKECPNVAHYALVYELLIGIPLLLAAAVAVAHSRSFRVRTVFQRILATTDALNIEGKIKALIGFVQVIAVIGPVYSIAMPNLYRVVLQALEVVYIDIFGDLFIPTECIGGFAWFLIVKSTFPVVVLALGIFVRCIWLVRSKTLKEDQSESSSLCGSVCRCLKAILIGVLPLTIWIGIFFCVSVSASIFSAFHCRRFVDNSDEGVYREFIIESLYIECPTTNYPASEDYYELRTLALILVACWPGTCLIGLFALLCAIRKRVLNRRPSKLSHAARVLTRDYKPAYFWWEFVELLRKLLLTGFVLAIPESVAFFRLVAALLFSVFFLVVQTMLAPFKDNDLQIFSLGLQSVVIVLFIGATYMYAYQQFGVAIANGGATVSWQEGRLSPLADVFVFRSLDDLALICLVGMCALGVALIFLAIHVAIVESNAEVLKLKRTRAAPVLTIRRQHQHHLFLSHVWSTGQDQAAVIKRQLVRMVHGMNIFLDVDDLEDIGALERCVDLPTISWPPHSSIVSVREGVQCLTCVATF
jgi:hypothetical protein